MWGQLSDLLPKSKVGKGENKQKLQSGEMWTTPSQPGGHANIISVKSC